MLTCYLGIGSNLGNRQDNIRFAINKLNKLKDTKVLKVSALVSSKPMGGSLQGDFLNGVIKIKTKLPPIKLLYELKKIEKELGRIKTVRDGPRTMDLDILLYGNKIIERKDLAVPHPRMFEREFVMKPLLEVL